MIFASFRPFRVFRGQKNNFQAISLSVFGKARAGDAVKLYSRKTFGKNIESLFYIIDL